MKRKNTNPPVPRRNRRDRRPDGKKFTKHQPYDYGRLLQRTLKRWGSRDWLSEQTGQRSRGVIDACHVVPKEAIKKRFPLGAIWSASEKCFYSITQEMTFAEDAKTVSLEWILMEVDLVVPGSRDLHSAWDDKKLVEAIKDVDGYKIGEKQIIPAEDFPKRTKEAISKYRLWGWVADYYEPRNAGNRRSVA